MKRLLTVLSFAFIMGTTAVEAETIYKVGSTPTGVPFTFLDSKTNTIQGVMVDVIAAIAKEEGFKIEIQPMEFSALVPSLASGKIDIISAAMSATAERAKVIDFTAAVYTYGEGLVVPVTDTQDYRSLDELKQKKIGAQIGSNYLNVLKAKDTFSHVGAYETLADVMRDVSNERMDAGLGDYPIFAYNIAQGRFPKVRLVKTYEPKIPSPVNMSVKKGNADLLAKINTGLEHMKTDGRLDAILKKWGL